jgi:hypothetical protein
MIPILPGIPGKNWKHSVKTNPHLLRISIVLFDSVFKLFVNEYCKLERNH